MNKEDIQVVTSTLSEVREHITEGSIKLFQGPQRSGKTLAGCLFALDAFKKGRNVFSTIEFAFPHTPLNFYDLKLSNETHPLLNGHVFIDELNFFLDARAAMSKVNRDFSSFILQIKKQGCNLTGTTHEISYLELRLRRSYDHAINCQVYPQYPHKPQILKMNIVNGPNQKYMNKTVKLDVRNLLGLYNTLNIYNPFEGATKAKGAFKPKEKFSL